MLWRNFLRGRLLVGQYVQLVENACLSLEKTPGFKFVTCYQPACDLFSDVIPSSLFVSSGLPTGVHCGHMAMQCAHCIGCGYRRLPVSCLPLMQGISQGCDALLNPQLRLNIVSSYCAPLARSHAGLAIQIALRWFADSGATAA